MDSPAHSFLYIMRNVLVSANLCAWPGQANSRFLFWVMVVSFVSLLLLRAGQAWTIRVASRGSRGGRVPSLKSTPTNTKNREARARTHKNKNKYRTRTHKHLNTKQIQRRARTRIQKQQKYHQKTGRTKTHTHTQPKYSYTYKYKRATSKYSRKYKPRERRSGRIREGFFFFARRLVCASTTRSELRDKTIFGRSK